MEKFTAMWVKVTCPLKIMPGNKKDISNKSSSLTSVDVNISVQNLIWNQGKDPVFNISPEVYREYNVYLPSWSFLQSGSVPKNEHFQGLEPKLPEQGLLVSWDQKPHWREASVGQDLPLCIHSHIPNHLVYLKDFQKNATVKFPQIISLQGDSCVYPARWKCCAWGPP